MRPKVAVVLGPWSSGTSAVARVVAALGANSHPPFTVLNDPHTPVSAESRGLRQILMPCFDHKTMTRKGTPRWATARLRIWAGPGLSVAKIPMLAWFLPEITAAWDCRFLIVRRPLEAIEATRERRGWPATYGRQGAERVYGLIRDGLSRDACSMDIAFETLRARPMEVGDSIATFLDTPLAPERVQAAIIARRDR